MSILAGVERCVLLHEGGEARIYKVYSGSKAYALKWYAEGSRIDARVMECLSGEKFAGVYHVLETGEKSNNETGLGLLDNGLYLPVLIFGLC